jgi:F0F1-type ATP synthase membrane subunit a
MSLLAISTNSMNRLFAFGVALVMGIMLAFATPAARADNLSQNNSGAQVIQAFGQQQLQRVNKDKLSEHRKHVIIFLLGGPLIIMILITGGLGIAMGVYGQQQLFAAHMISAGLTITLALVHAVVSVVWFFPF